MKSIYKFVPHEKLKLETSLSKEEVLKRLSANIEQNSSKWNWFIGKSSSKIYFGGSLYETGFQVSRNISYRNSFLPEIEGKIEALRFGCTIDLKLTLNIFVRILGIIWLLGALIASIVALSVYFSSSSTEQDAGMLTPLMMLGPGYVAFIGFFKYESIKARKYLMELLEASEVNP